MGASPDSAQEGVCEAVARRAGRAWRSVSSVSEEPSINHKLPSSLMSACMCICLSCAALVIATRVDGCRRVEVRTQGVEAIRRPKRHCRSTCTCALITSTSFNCPLFTCHITTMPPNKGGNSKKEAGRAKKAENEVGGGERGWRRERCSSLSQAAQGGVSGWGRVGRGRRARAATNGRPRRRTRHPRPRRRPRPTSGSRAVRRPGPSCSGPARLVGGAC